MYILKFYEVLLNLGDIFLVKFRCVFGSVTRNDIDYKIFHLREFFCVRNFFKTFIFFSFGPRFDLFD